MSENKEEYRRFIKNRKDIPVFFQDWWLDVVSGSNNWEVILIKGKQQEVQLIMPYIVSSRLGFQVTTQIPLTSFLGARIIYPSQNLKDAKKNSYEKGVLDKLSKAIEETGVYYFNQLFSPDFKNWLPLFWNGFQQTTYYRYVLNDIKNKEQIFNGFKYNKKYELNKFEKDGNAIEESEDANLMYEFVKYSYHKDQSKIPFSGELYQKLDSAVKENGHRKIFIAKDNTGVPVAALYLVIDFDRAFLLNTGMDYRFKDSTAKTALIWHAIKYASEFVDTFDFCGSMIEPIAVFFQGFGGTLEPYSRIYKYRNRLVQTVFSLRRK